MDSLITVSVAPTASLLASVGSLREDIGDTAMDGTFATRLIADASGLIADHLGYPLGRSTVVETFRLTETAPYLPLSRRPVTSITSIVADDVTLASDQWELDSDLGFLYALSSDARVEWSSRKIVVTYVAGYFLPGQSGANLPRAIERAALLTASALYHAGRRDPRLRSESVDGVGAQSWVDPIAADGQLPPLAADMLRSYVRRVV